PAPAVAGDRNGPPPTTRWSRWQARRLLDTWPGFPHRSLHAHSVLHCFGGVWVVAGSAAGGVAGGVAGCTGTSWYIGGAGAAALWLAASGCSSCSTGKLSFGGITGTGPVMSIPGVRGAVVAPSLRGCNGIDSSGRGWPSGIGRTISGVTITSNSVFSFDRWRDWKSLPKNGMSPRPGTLSRVSITRLSSKPAIAKL